MGKKSIPFALIVLFTLFFILIFYIPSGYCLFDKFFTKRQIVKWNESNAKNVDFDILKCANYKDEEDTFLPSRLCFFEGTITNNTADTIKKVIIPFIIFSNHKEVLRKNICLDVTVYPSGTIKINQCFTPLSNDFKNHQLTEIKHQLGEAYGWGLGDVIFIPKLESLDEYSQLRLGIDIDYNFDYDADKQIAE
jgi:hypothetical protein